jgi:hypothetical protein
MITIRQLFIILIFALSLGCRSVKQEITTKDLSSNWDTITPLANPHKGWYHHLLDNGIKNYTIKDRDAFKRFPGMDHLYIRIAWSYLEPKEGELDWTIIDNVINQYVPEGYGISFRITSKETGTYPGSVGQEVDGIQYATPKWVKDAGAKGKIAEMWNIKSWTPVWDDPIFLSKLDSFHKAFAERYDGKPFVRYIDVGSIGEWGEGHTSFSTKIPPTVAEVKANMDIYQSRYPKSLLVVTDDLIYYGKSKEEANELLQYAFNNGFSIRDDSPLVDWYIENYAETFSVSHPHFFETAYLKKPVIYELQHYHMVKRDGNWKGKNGSEVIPGKDISGADIFKESLKIIRATYIGYHGYLEDWLEDNPDLTGELVNLCGYWYFPKSVSFHKNVSKKNPLEFSIEWLNKGVAPAYHKYNLELKMECDTTYKFELTNSNNLDWMPNDPFIETYSIDLLDKISPGIYKMKVKLTSNTEHKQEVKLGLDSSLMDSEGFYEVFNITII